MQMHRLFQFAIDYGYLSLAALSFVDGAGAPVTAEMILIAFTVLVQQGSVQFWPALLLGAAANTAGSLLLLAVARYAGERFLIRWLKPETRERVQKLLASFGAITLILTRVTSLMRMPAVALAGLMRMPMRVVAPALFAGAVLWLYLGYFVVRFIGLRASHVAHHLRGRWLEIALVVGLIAVGVIAHRLHRRRMR